MNNDFPRIITLLRKEQGISQKQAAADLGISQALLSHYEKGIRECGLDFILRTSEYYGVSCDYLLGKTPHRQGEKLHVPETDEVRVQETIPNVDRKIISNSIHIVFGILKKINSKSLTRQVTVYLCCAVYNAFRMLYCANAKNPKGIFETEEGLSTALTNGRMQLALAKSRILLSGEKTEAAQDDEKPEAPPAMTSESLSQEYPDWAPSLFTLIRNTEREHTAN
ncbi:MAG: helix-turn-helix transcriptional regulator [Clostridia bacterium]|nr:helix-turn-helix transcriptional regulator [Clostridia bacterium]